MNFNSPIFFVFLSLVFLIYWKLRRRKQNAFLLFCNYVFYGWWDWRFLLLIFASSLIDFIIGRKIFQTSAPRKKKQLLLASLVVNLVILGFFKYFNFFAESLQDLLSILGLPHLSFATLRIILPLGISFYTFQKMTYAIEIYQGKIRPAESAVEFFAFVSFFPQILSGPIERASTLLSQFREERTFQLAAAYDGLRRILWGLFKKVVIADNLATVVQWVYGNMAIATGPQLFAAAFFFTFQLYCDFSGYSDIAIGTARLFGFKLGENFNGPFFSKSIAEFWRRWHISLSSWFKDYVFTPLYFYFSKLKRLQPIGYKLRHWVAFYLAILLGDSLLGLWHGANWAFVLFGLYHGLFVALYYLCQKQWDRLPGYFRIIVTFFIVMFSFVFFRADSVSDAFYIITHISPGLSVFFSGVFLKKTIMIAGFIWAEWRQRAKPHILCLEQFPVWLRWSVYYALIAGLFFMGNFDYHPFIYFKF